MELKREDLEVIRRLIFEDLETLRMMKKDLLFQKNYISNVFFDTQLLDYNSEIDEDEKLLVKILNFMEE